MVESIEARISDVLVLGKGHLGSYLQSRWGLNRQQHWTQEICLVDASLLRRQGARVVVNCAGKTHLAWCEENQGECFRSNVAAPLSVYRAVQDAWGERGLYIHLSSGCVWDGPFRKDGQPFGPTDPVRPACFYSWTKAACDALLLSEATTPIAILRPRQLFSPVLSPRNTLQKLNGYEGLIDTPNSMTSAETLARTIERIATEPKVCAEHRVWNVYDRGITSPYQVGCLLARAGCREMPRRLDRDEMDSWLAPRRVDAVIHDSCFEEILQPPAIEQELERVIADFANNLRAKEH